MISKAEPRRPKHDLRVLAVVWLATFLFSNSLFSIQVALPVIQKEFGGSLAALQWVGLMGFVISSSLALCFGRAGDSWGRVRLYRTGIVLYTLGSVLCTLAASLPQLIAFRVPMAIGLAMATPMSPAILASTYPPEKRGQVLGWLASALAVGRTTGPTVGGLLLYWNWRAIFMANLLIGGLVALASFKVLEKDEARRSESFDYLGALLVMIGYPALLMALSLGPAAGWSSALVLFCFGLSLSGLVGFVINEFGAKEPLVRPSLFKNSFLPIAILSLLLSSAALYPVSTFAPLYMRNVLEFSSFKVGLIMTAFPLFTAFSAPLSGYLGDRGGSTRVATLGLVFIFAGLFLYSSLGAESDSLTVGAALALLGMGSGFFVPANQRLVFATSGSENYGILSAMLTSFGPAAGSIGTAVTTALIEASLVGSASENPVGFAGAQQFAFSCLLPVSLIAALIALFRYPIRRNQ